jgi:xanthine dehydrogenase large subunit
MNNIDSIGHVTGKSVYLDDIPVQKGTLHAAVFSSPVAHGEIIHIDISAAQTLQGIEKIFTHKDIPGNNQIGGIIEDEPLFAENEVHFRGQPIALIVAKDQHTARKALKLIEIKIEEKEAITDPRIAKQKGLLLIPPRTFRMGNITGIWQECAYIFEGKADSGGQEHLYIETQGSYSYPTDNDCIKIHSSTQSPTLVQKIASRVLGIPMNRIEVDVARLGGGFGGKEDQATGFAAMAALASFLLKKLPVNVTPTAPISGLDFRVNIKSSHSRLHFTRMAALQQISLRQLWSVHYSIPQMHIIYLILRSLYSAVRPTFRQIRHSEVLVLHRECLLSNRQLHWQQMS